MRPDPSTITIRILIVVIACLGLFRAGAAASDENVNIAGLMVDYGDGSRSYALIPFSDDVISGLDLLEASGLPLLMIDFGGMGAGICMIERTGCDVSACRLRLCQTSDPDSAFWQLMQEGDDGSWSFAPRGISAAKLQDGDVNGWFWTGTTPTGSVPSVEEIATLIGVDLDSIRTNRPLDEVLVTLGGSETPSATNDPWAIASGIAIIGGIGGLGLFALIRTRGAAQP